jgi:hypothetical protein
VTSRNAAARRRSRPDPTEAAIAKRIAAGEQADAFLCIDCFCWSLEPAFCGCWARAVFVE